MFNALIDRFQAKFPPNRLVALALVVLTAPLTVASGYVATWVPAHFPGLPAFTPVQLLAFGLAGAGAVLLPAIVAGYKWLDGWQKHEASGRHLEEALVAAGHLPANAEDLVFGLPASVPPPADLQQPAQGEGPPPPPHGGVSPDLRTPPPAS